MGPGDHSDSDLQLCLQALVLTLNLTRSSFCSVIELGVLEISLKNIKLNGSPQDKASTDCAP